NDNQTVFSAYISLIEKRKREYVNDLIERLNERLDKPRHSSENTVRTKYLILVMKHGNEVQVERAINQTNEWWDNHFDQNVITALISLIESRRKNELASIITKAKKYLSKYPNKSQTLSKKIESIENKFV
ncbi:MAG: hypothetical protein AB1498_02275, partial [bacterium]